MSKLLSIKARKLLKLHRFILQKIAKCNAKDANTILANAPIELIKTLSIIFKLLAEGKLNINKRFSKVAKDYIVKHRLHKLNLRQLRETLIKHPKAPFTRLMQHLIPVIIQAY